MLMVGGIVLGVGISGIILLILDLSLFLSF